MRSLKQSLITIKDRRIIRGSPDLDYMIAKFCLIAASIPMIAGSLFAQAAVSSSTNPQGSATPQPSPSVPENEGVAPRIPAIDDLDQAFKQSSLGKAADEARLHAQWRELSKRSIWRCWHKTAFAPRLLLLLAPRQESRRKRARLLRRNLNCEHQNRLCRNSRRRRDVISSVAIQIWGAHAPSRAVVRASPTTFLD